MANRHTIHAFDYLDDPTKYEPAAVSVIFGDEPFLKQLVVRQIQNEVLGSQADELPYTKMEGETVLWRDVLDELSTFSLFGSGQRLVAVTDADRFVSRHRSALEEYLEHPHPTGVLLLQVDSWPSNTRLYKSIGRRGLQIACQPPQRTTGRRKVLDEDRLLEWLIWWAKRTHRITLIRQAAELMYELIGPALGILDQELSKLALFVEEGGKITSDMVRDVVGGWRTKTAWELIDAAVEGNAGEALRQLDALVHAGENALAIFGPFSWSLRRYATATRIVQSAERQQQRISLPTALEEAGFRKWPRNAIDDAQRHLRQIGRERADQLYRRLLQADLALKGTHSHPLRARLVLEMLIVQLSNASAKERSNHT